MGVAKRSGGALTISNWRMSFSARGVRRNYLESLASEQVWTRRSSSLSAAFASTMISDRNAKFVPKLGEYAQCLSYVPITQAARLDGVIRRDYKSLLRLQQYEEDF